jgi:putative hydrolase
MGVSFSSISDFWRFYMLNFMGKFNKGILSYITKKNTDAVVNAIKKNKIDILTHPGDKIPVNIDKIAAEAELKGTILEISNSHGHLNSKEIMIAAQYDVKFAIDSDSHIKDTIGGFEQGLKEAIDANLDLKRVVNLIL